MDFTKINPCEYERYARTIAWAETDCWCCTATRAALVALVLGVAIGLVCAGSFRAAAWFLVIAAPLTVAALIIARKIWKDAYTEDGGHER